MLQASPTWRFTLLIPLLTAAIFSENVAAQPPAAKPTEAEMAGYLLVPHQRVDRKYDGGFGMYVTAWPLLKNYPGQRFQTGLFGTWMFAQYEGQRPKDSYSDIEGGLGWWRDTRFATETPKFIMGGVAKSFSEWANGPGAGKGRDWDRPNGKYGVAQLSPHVVWPPDGLNLKQGTRGELFGYGYLPLPLTEPMATTSGQEVATGDQSWTLFLNTENFKGPVAFFTPWFWTKPSLNDPSLEGMFLDTRPSDPNKAIQMETQYVPAYQSVGPDGVTYARVAPTQFPLDADGNCPLAHRVMAFQKQEYWKAMKAWFDGGEVFNGRVSEEALAEQAFEPAGGSTWRIYPPGTARDDKIRIGWNDFATPTTLDRLTYAYKWNHDLVTTSQTESPGVVTLPQYFRLGKDNRDKPVWTAVSAADVPAETGLADLTFPRAERKKIDPYVTPEDPNDTWHKPGPVAGPFQLKLGDGSLLTYSWYRFADQPALMNADLSLQQREAMQKKVELLHRHWPTDRDYLPPPTRSPLASLDPALLVTPPKGFEYGYVPIATRQEPAP
ncbi:MAG: hypothetical protein KDA81_11040 [Planctomycetaceae bacterium]|nr:hypothetical protein [Planctomycetaceae bacterium]